MVKEVRAKQVINACSPIVFTLLPIATEVRLMKPANAPSPTEVTPSSTTTDMTKLRESFHHGA
jgi:hypothetical protein